MRVNVFAAVGAGVAVEQVLDAVHKTAQPVAVNGRFHVLAVDQQHFQQVGQMRRRPVARDKAFRKADVASAQRGSAGVPVDQVQAGHGG